MIMVCCTAKESHRCGDGYNDCAFIHPRVKFKQPFKSGLKAKDEDYLTLSYWPCHGKRHIMKGGQRTANIVMVTLAL